MRAFVVVLALGAATSACGELGRAVPVVAAVGPAATPQDLVDRYALASIAAGAPELERVAALRDWVHGRWRHDSWHEPEAFDSAQILEAATKGERFRCVEYGFVLADVYQALGWPARVVRFEGKGAHVATEVFVRSLDRWVLMDAQFAAHVLDERGLPLSGLELRDALRRQERPSVAIREGAAADYLEFMEQYLRYVMVTGTRGFGKSLTTLLVLVDEGDAAPEGKPAYLVRAGTRYVITNESARLRTRP